MTFKRLYKIILSRKKSLPKKSYVASLIKDGRNRIAQKVGEEAVEVIIAAGNNKNQKQRLVEEISDLFFHILVLMVANDISIEDIEGELEKRCGQNQV